MRFKLRIVVGAAILAIVALVAWRSYPHRDIRPGDHIEVRVDGTLIGQPISGVYRVDEDGKITLGPAYGRVAVAGCDTDGAISAITTGLKRSLRTPEVAVSRLGNDVVSRLEAENHRLQAENAVLNLQILQSRVTTNPR